MGILFLAFALTAMFTSGTVQTVLTICATVVLFGFRSTPSSAKHCCSKKVPPICVPDSLDDNINCGEASASSRVCDISPMSAWSACAPAASPAASHELLSDKDRAE